MVIQFDSQRFSFLLKVGKYDMSSNYTSHNIKFYDSLESLNDSSYEPEIKIREYSDVTLTINTEEKFQIEIDGMDGVDNLLTNHEDGCYVDIPAKNIEIFSANDFPLPPGRFVIKIKLEDKIYYTGFEVYSGRMADEMWQLMAKEVLESLKLMAFQFVHSRLAMAKIDKEHELLGALFIKIGILTKHYSNVVSALDGLITSPHSKIAKKYTSLNSNYKYPMDGVAYKLNGRNGRLNKIIYPQKYTDYDLAENIYVKSIVKDLSGIIDSFILEMDEKLLFLKEKISQDFFGRKNKNVEYLRNINTLATLEEYYGMARKLKGVISQLKNTEWYRSIKVNKFAFVPAQSMLDPRYGILSKLSNELKANTVRFDIDTKLSLIWKRSDKLYEMWGFLKIVEQLEKIGFVLQQGPNVVTLDKVIKIAALDSEQGFMLKKDAFTVKAYYDKILPGPNDFTDKEYNPIYTTALNNKPDVRLDFYYTKEKVFYIASLIVDFKYRKKQGIWGNDDFKLNYTDCRSQLTNYANQTKTKFYADYEEQQSINAIRPVREVWALYPNQYDVTEETDKNNFSVKLFSFVPGYEEVISKHLDKFFIENVVNYTQKLGTNDINYKSYSLVIELLKQGCPPDSISLPTVTKEKVFELKEKIDKGIL